LASDAASRWRVITKDRTVRDVTTASCVARCWISARKVWTAVHASPVPNKKIAANVTHERVQRAMCHLQRPGPYGQQIGHQRIGTP